MYKLPFSADFDVSEIAHFQDLSEQVAMQNDTHEAASLR